MPNYINNNQLPPNQLPTQNQLSPQNQLPQNQLPQNQYPQNRIPSNQIPQPIIQTQPPQIQKQLPPQQPNVPQPTLNYNNQVKPVVIKEDNGDPLNSINSMFRNYEPKIKYTENLRDEEINAIDKYVSDPEVKGVEELGIINILIIYK